MIIIVVVISSIIRAILNSSNRVFALLSRLLCIGRDGLITERIS